MATFNFNFSIFQKLQLKVIAFAANTRNFCHFLKNLWLVTLEEKAMGRMPGRCSSPYVIVQHKTLIASSDYNYTNIIIIPLIAFFKWQKLNCLTA